MQSSHRAVTSALLLDGITKFYCSILETISHCVSNLQKGATAPRFILELLALYTRKLAWDQTPMLLDWTSISPSGLRFRKALTLLHHIISPCLRSRVHFLEHISSVCNVFGLFFPDCIL